MVSLQSNKRLNSSSTPAPYHGMGGYKRYAEDLTHAHAVESPHDLTHPYLPATPGDLQFPLADFSLEHTFSDIVTSRGQEEHTGLCTNIS